MLARAEPFAGNRGHVGLTQKSAGHICGGIQAAPAEE